MYQHDDVPRPITGPHSYSLRYFLVEAGCWLAVLDVHSSSDVCLLLLRAPNSLLKLDRWADVPPRATTVKAKQQNIPATLRALVRSEAAVICGQVAKRVN